MTNTLNYNKIPIEIWIKTFLHLSPRELLECQKVCKIWNSLTRPLFWKNIQLNTEIQVKLLLQGASKDTMNIIKSIGLGNESVNGHPDEYSLTKTKVKQLFFKRGIENISITLPFSINLAELNNQEFLMEFRESCPDIKSFNVYRVSILQQAKDYADIMYSLRNTLTSIIIDRLERVTYRQITSFTQLEHVTMYEIFWNPFAFVEFLCKTKVLPRLKSLQFCMNIYDNWIQEDGNDMDYIQKKIENDQLLKSKLKYLEKLYVSLENTEYSSNHTNIITQYFIGLKDIQVHYDSFPRLDDSQDDLIFSQWMRFICSHNTYIATIHGCYISADKVDTIVNATIQTNFMHPSTNSTVSNQLEVTLDGIDHDRNEEWYTDDGVPFEMYIAKKFNHSQHLKIAKIYFAYSESYMDTIYNVMNPVESVIKCMHTLAFKLYVGEKHFPFNSFRLFGDILSMTGDTFKKMIIYVPSKFKWNQYFIKYEKIKTYRQVTYLDIVVDGYSGVEMDEQILSQFMVLFPCIKYLDLQYYSGIWNSQNYEFLINLPQISLKKLTLDINTIKQKMQKLRKTHYTTFESFFILRVQTSKKTYYYKISSDSLNVSELTENCLLDESIFAKNYLKLCIILKDIQCFEMYVLNKITQSYLMYAICSHVNYDIPQRIFEHRIYFK